MLALLLGGRAQAAVTAVCSRLWVAPGRAAGWRPSESAPALGRSRGRERELVLVLGPVASLRPLRPSTARRFAHLQARKSLPRAGRALPWRRQGMRQRPTGDRAWRMRGKPVCEAAVITAVVILDCLAHSFLLAHSAGNTKTVSRVPIH